MLCFLGENERENILSFYKLFVKETFVIKYVCLFFFLVKKVNSTANKSSNVMIVEFSKIWRRFQHLPV